MVDDRTVRAVLLLTATGAVVGGLWALASPSGPPPLEGAEVTLVVEEPDGSLLFDGPVRSRNATVLGTLDAGAEAGGFPYETRTFSMGVQVVSINGTENEGSSGWVYRVLRDGTWCWGDRSSDRYEVHTGDVVRWEWSEGPPPGGCWEAGEEDS